MPTVLPPPQRQSAREELGTWGREEGPATVPRQVERFRAGGRDRRPRTGSPLGSLACAPPRRLRDLLRLQSPHPATRRQTWTQPLQPSSLCGTTQKWSVTAATSVPQSSNPHLCEGMATSCPWRPQKAFTCGEPGPRANTVRPHGRSPGRQWQPLLPGLGLSPGLSRVPGALSRPGSAHAVP